MNDGRRGEKGDTGAPGMTAGARHSFIFLTVLIFLIAGAALIVGVREIGGLQAQIRAECKFDGDIGTFPVTINSATGKASLLGVAIVSDARVAWHGHGCTGQIPAAAPSFIRWARYYHLPFQ